MIWIILLILFLLLSFALSGLESAVHAISRVRVRHAAGAGDKRAAYLLPLVEDRDALLGAITVSNHITNLMAFIILTWKLMHISGPWAYVITFFVTLPFFLIVLEVLPKKLFRRYPFRTMRTLTPLILLVGLVRPLFRAFSTPQTESPSVPYQSLGRDDLYHKTDLLTQQGKLSPGAAGLIQRALHYRKLKTEAVMRPLNQSIALSSELPVKTALIMAREHSVTTLPVLSEQGKFEGVLNLASLPALLPPDRLVRHHMLKLDIVHAQDSALLTLQRMRKRARTLALVLDKDQEPVGLVSEEDLLDHLMGTRAHH